MEEFKILRKIQKTIKKELYELKIKIYYEQLNLNISNVIDLLDVYDIKKKQLILVKSMRHCPKQ